MPELLRIAEEVDATGEPRVLRRDDRDIAVVMPVSKSKPAARRRKGRTKTKEDMEAFRSAAGGWKDVDTDKLVADIYESRRSSKPPVNL